MSKLKEILAGVALPIALAFVNAEVEDGLESFKNHNSDEKVTNSLKAAHSGLLVLAEIVKSTKGTLDDTLVGNLVSDIEKFAAQNNIEL